MVERERMALKATGTPSVSANIRRPRRRDKKVIPHTAHTGDLVTGLTLIQMELKGTALSRE